MKTAAILQSNYIPWKGYFDLIHDVDEFIFYDEVQYTVRDWRNRNLIKNREGLKWLTIPVGSDYHRKIKEVELPNNLWQNKHLDLLTYCYSKTPFFNKYRDLLDYIYTENKWTNLSELNQTVIKMISKEILGIKTEFSNSEKYPSEKRRSEKLIEILLAAGANTYISGPAAKRYIDEDLFRNNNIELIWKDYDGYPEYPQLYAPFEHNVTILDLLFYTGNDAAWYIWGWRQG